MGATQLFRYLSAMPDPRPAKHRRLALTACGSLIKLVAIGPD